MGRGNTGLSVKCGGSCWRSRSASDVENALGLGLDGEDAFDGVERIGAEANGPLQGGQQVGAGVGGQQGEHLEGLVFAVALAGQQAVEEACGDWARVRRSVRAAWPRFAVARRWADALATRSAVRSRRVGTGDGERSSSIFGP